MNLTADDIDVLEQYWVDKSRKNFLAYRKFMRAGSFKDNWFIQDLCRQLQQFYLDYKAGKRPVLLIQTPPQHGKSWAVADFIAWMSGKIPELRSIYASYSDTLGVRCNLSQQRQMDSEKYVKIFPDTRLAPKRGVAIRNTELLEFVDEDGNATGGQFRNTTTLGSVTGESLDLGVIDDAVKGREQANSLTQSQKTWEWFTDDFGTRFADTAGLIVIMTRWTVHDLVGRMVDEFPQAKVINYEAIATKEDVNRTEGEALFPELKSLDFLLGKKKLMAQASWESLYQGSPTIKGGNMIKDSWWRWYKTGNLPPLKYKFITADTAQKIKTMNDWTSFHCYGRGIDGNIYLLDKKREKWESPDLRREAEIFYKKWNQPKYKVDDPVLRGMYIEDKSSGSGLIQELRRLRLNVIEVPRSVDKVLRVGDASPYIENGFVWLNTDIEGVDNLTKEGREFPESEFDDDLDTCITAIEITYINQLGENSLKAAMEARDE